MKKPIKEGILNKFVDSFIDSYKRGLDKYFIEKSAERNPELAKALRDTSDSLADLQKVLDRINKKK
jgi:hypothetical protein